MTEQQFLQDLEKKLWASANTLRSNISAALYRDVVLGLVFLKYVSDSMDTRREELRLAFIDPENDYYLGEDANEEFIQTELETRDYYIEKNVFWVPAEARWQYIQDNAGLTIGAELPLGGEFKGLDKLLDNTMDIVEKANPKLKNILNKGYTRLELDPIKLKKLVVEIISTIPFNHDSLDTKDIIGHIYEYFLGKFALEEGQNGGKFYTPKSIVNLIVEMLEPYKGRVYDPAMGSGGFFVSSEKFIEEHSGRIGDISVYGQESDPTTWKLAIMNMVIRGIDFDFGKQPRSTFTNDQHLDLRADFVLANPPFNQDEDDWWDASLDDDARWKYGTPPKGNANYAWIQHMLHHTSTNGVVGLVLSNGSLSTTTGGEDSIRKAIIEADLLEAIVALPTQLFGNTQIPACIWILNRNKSQKDKTLFIDAREAGYMIDRKQRAFDVSDIKAIADTFHKFRVGTEYEDVVGEYYGATTEEIAKQDYILTPGRYVGVLEEEGDGVPFAEKMVTLTATLGEQFEQSARLEREIKKNLLGLGYEL
jgi:type I restriction enzyme M protein